MSKKIIFISPMYTAINNMARVSEIGSVILGAIATILLLVGVFSVNSGDIRGLGSIAMIFFHFIIVMIALPFLFIAIYKTEIIPRWFRTAIFIESGLNAFFMLLNSNAASGDKSMFFVSAILELLPVLLIYFRRDFIEIKDIIR